MDSAKKAGERQWLLLIHQLPPTPAYLRVKIGRHLQRLGAVAIKNSVYVLPANEQAREDFAWVYREILEGGGDASVCEARFFEGLSNEQVEELFHDARHADYQALGQEARALQKAFPRRGEVSGRRRAELEAQVARLEKQLAEIVAIDFFGTPHRVAVEGLVTGLAARLRGGASGGARESSTSLRVDDVRGRIWVTRKNVGVDRIASAWLVRRFIAPDARFKFVNGQGYAPEPGELRFDMFEAEFTHEGDRCTFEVLLDRFGISDPALRTIAEVVHDMDLQDDKFGRPERAGLDRLLDGLAASEPDDEARLARGSALFGDLYQAFSREAG
jgi:hypothetical protein